MLLYVHTGSPAPSALSVDNPSPELLLPLQRPLLAPPLLKEVHPLAAKPWDMGALENEDMAGREALKAPPAPIERIAAAGILDLMAAAWQEGRTTGSARSRHGLMVDHHTSFETGFFVFGVSKSATTAGKTQQILTLAAASSRGRPKEG